MRQIGKLTVSRYLAALFVAGLLLVSQSLLAHESRPVFVDIKEIFQGADAGAGTQARFQVQWKIPSTVPVSSVPSLLMPPHCAAQSAPLKRQQQGAYIGKQIYLCDGALAGYPLAVKYPTVNPSVSTLFHVSLLNGEQHTRILKPGVDSWILPAVEDSLGVAREYTLLGIQHIWEGIDHLLFVACLIFIARTQRRILITITGFTLAHSLTLMLSTLGLVQLPVPPVEAVIALSIVFLAHEIVVNNSHSWTHRFPVSVSSSFGLLHGFGFAAVLRDLGLPQTELGTALLFFNVGVEIGQLLFILVLLTVFVSGYRMLRSGASDRGSLSTIAVLQTPVGYVIGTVACYWLLQRISGFWL